MMRRHTKICHVNNTSNRQEDFAGNLFQSRLRQDHVGGADLCEADNIWLDMPQEVLVAERDAAIRIEPLADLLSGGKIKKVMAADESGDRPLYNSRITNSYIKLIKCNYSYIDIDELLRYAEIEPYQVEDEGHWFTQKQINRFHDRLSELTGNRDIAREAGLFSVSPEALGGIKQYLLGMASPAEAYRLVGKFTGKFTRSSTYETRNIGPNTIEIICTSQEGVREEPFQCENRKGYLEAISKVFNYRLPKIEHPECIFKGGHSCRYIVSWQKSRAAVLKRIRNIALLLFVATLPVLPFLPPAHVTHALLAPASLILLLSWYAEFLSTRELRAAVDHLGVSSDNLIEQINLNYDNALMINEIGQALSVESDIDGVLEKISSILQKRLDYDRGLVMLADPAKTRLLYRAGYGYTDEQANILKKISFHLDNPESKGIFTVSFKEKKPFLVNNLDELKDTLSPRSLEMAEQLGVKSLICCPIIHQEGSLGILAVDNTTSKRPLLQRDINLLMGIAPLLGARISRVVLEAQLRQTQKMEAVGSLAGGIAHDFNNMLTSILGYSQMLAQKLSEDDPLQKMVGGVRHAGEKAAELTRKLLAFSRKQAVEMKVSNLNIIVEDIGKMLDRLIGEDVVMELQTAKTIGNIMADPGQIEQVLMNLAVNARDAMPGGGRLTITTGETVLDEKNAQDRAVVKSGLYAMLTVSDTGCGMTPEVRERIFEPFFTTKEIGKGTGLGLATVYGIVQQHNGQIFVDSVQDKGTTFKILFPVVSGQVEQHASKEKLTMPRGTETMLVVDDDSSIRRLLFDVLTPLGYTILMAASGEKALALSRKTAGKIDLILSDVIMPGMDGRELIDKIKLQRPDIKTVLMSGYTENVVARKGAFPSSCVLVNKPFLPVALTNKLRTVLDGTAVQETEDRGQRTERQ